MTLQADNVQSTLQEIESREAEFWDTATSHLTDDDLQTEKVNPDQDALDRSRVALLGRLVGKRVLDVGCGSGLWSVFMASKGAEVWAVDISPQSVALTKRRAELNGVSTNINAAVMSAVEMDFPSGFFDLVHGQDIIHHLDATSFGKEVARVLKPTGRAVFSENCANNPLLMFARNNLCGRWGIPKWSSDDEYPLTRARLAQFGRFFKHTDVEYPSFLFFHYLNAKFFRYESDLVNRLAGGADRAIWAYLPFLRQYSYRQIICCRNPLLLPKDEPTEANPDGVAPRGEKGFLVALIALLALGVILWRLKPGEPAGHATRIDERSE